MNVPNGMELDKVAEMVVDMVSTRWPTWRGGQGGRHGGQVDQHGHLCGSHGLNARTAQKAKASRPEGPPARIRGPRLLVRYTGMIIWLCILAAVVSRQQSNVGGRGT